MTFIALEEQKGVEGMFYLKLNDEVRGVIDIPGGKLEYDPVLGIFSIQVSGNNSIKPFISLRKEGRC